VSNESWFVEGVSFSGLLRKMMIEKVRLTQRPVCEYNLKAIGNFIIPIIADNAALTTGPAGNA
jgi:hypothetical protein